MDKKIDQKKYLQKYLNPKPKKKKIKSNSNNSQKRVNIIDDDIDVTQLMPIKSSEIELYATGEDAPQIAGIIDERPTDVQLRERFKFNTGWQVINEDDGVDSHLIVKEKTINKHENEMESNVANSDDDLNISRRTDSDEDLNVSRRRARYDSDEDLNVSRKRKQYDSDDDLNVSRKRKQHDSEMRKKHKNSIDLDIPLKHKKLEKDTKLKMNSNPSKNIVKFNIRNPDHVEQKLKAENRQKQEEKYAKWGKGLKQVEDRTQQLLDESHEMSKPLARYANDEDLEKYLKEQEREGDPMLEYIRKEQKTKKSSNHCVDNKSDKPKYDGQFMPNRFGIAPGYRWDGVDRSNGYETNWFNVRNAKKIVDEEAYKWSIDDM